MEIEAYTDGGCNGNPGCGAWAFVIVDAHAKSILKSQSGYASLTTNNRMELQAVIEVLRTISRQYRDIPITLFTDAQYVQKGITIWIHRWIKNGWKSSQKKLIKNIELWQQLYTLHAEVKISWRWLRGHNENYYNEYCHTMVQKQISVALKQM